MTRETVLLLAQLDAGEIQPIALANWAVGMLDAGYEADHLGMLAALIWEHSPDSREILHLFALVVGELGWKMPPPEESGKAYALTLAEGIVSGAIEPVDGCCRLYVVSRQMKDGPVKQAWTDLDRKLEIYWAMHSYDVEMGVAADAAADERELQIIKAAIIREARRFLAAQ